MARGDVRHGRPTSDIPLLPTPLIGRQEEIAAARDLLRAGCRLLTFSGPPGVGKTSLALALAADLAGRYADGALVDLSPVAQADLVAAAIADALGIAGRRPNAERLVGALRNWELLLILDNFEQVVDAASVVSRLLAGCPRLTVVVTSRVPLRVRWEQELSVPPLALPAAHGPQTLDALADVPAVRLFDERARAVNRYFGLTDENAAVVAEICARLDGLPLAIELAAARTRLLTPAAILRQLRAFDAADGRSSTLGLLTDGPRDLPARQQTLRDAIAWSYALLDDAEQRLFRRLAVFVGGCTLGAVERVTRGEERGASSTHSSLAPDPSPLTLVASLVEKALLQQVAPSGQPDGASEPRVRMLQTVREFALEQLQAAGERGRLEERHSAYFVDLAERAAPALPGADQAAWLDRLEADRDNLNAAEHRAAARGDVETVLRLGAALWRFWWMRGDAAEARERIDAVVALGRSGADPSSQARALHGAGVLAHQLGDYVAARALFDESLALARRVGERRTEAAVLHNLGRIGFTLDALDDASAWLTASRAIATEIGDDAALAETLRLLGQIAYLRADFATGEVLCAEGLARARAAGDPRVVAQVTHDVGLMRQARGEADSARGRYEEALGLFRALGDRSSIAMALHNVANAALAQGDLGTARASLSEGIPLAAEVGDRRRVSFMVSAAASVLAGQDPERAIRLDAASLAFGASIGARQSRPMRQIYDARLASAASALGEAGLTRARLLGQTTTLEQAIEEAVSWLGEPPVLPSSPREARDQPRLTRREREVAALIAQGCSNREIAEALTVAEGTAANHVFRLMSRLGFHNRAQVAAWAVEQRLHE